MDRRHVLCSMLALASTPSSAFAQPLPPLTIIPQAQKVGSGRLIVMMIPVLDATLYSPQGQWHEDKPFALKLDYLRPLEGPGMARRAVTEMRSLGFHDEALLQTWRTEMASIFPDVRNGDSMTALRDEAGATLFFKGEHQIGKIVDNRFSQHFFAICLSPQTSQPALRKSLLGQT